MLSFHEKYSKDFYSQNGEDGVVEEVLRRLDLSKGLAVEFGAHNGSFCSNSRYLILNGWRGHLIEADPNLFDQIYKLYEDNLFVFMKQGFVYPGNVNYVIPEKIDILSIDVDGIDAAIWDAYQGDAKIVIIEINSSLPPMSDTYADPELGTSYKMMWRLGLSKGYFLLCHCGNMIFVKMEYMLLFPEIFPLDRPPFHPLNDIDLFFNKSWLK